MRFCPKCNNVKNDDEFKVLVVTSSGKKCIDKQCADCAIKFKKKRRHRGYQKRKRAKDFGVEIEYGIKPIDIFKRDGNICYLCGIKCVRSKEFKPNKATLDHVIPLSKGGGHTWANLRCCCAKCNLRKSNK